MSAMCCAAQPCFCHVYNYRRDLLLADVFKWIKDSELLNARMTIPKYSHIYIVSNFQVRSASVARSARFGFREPNLVTWCRQKMAKRGRTGISAWMKESSVK